MTEKKAIAEASLDCLKQLLTNVAATGGYELLTTLVTTTAVGATAAMASSVALPALAVGILGYIGLRWASVRREIADKDKLDSLLRSIIDGRYADQEHIRRELAAMGLELTLDLREVQANIDVVKGLAQAAATDLAKAVALLEKHEGLFISLERFILDNVSELKEHLGTKLDAIQVILNSQPLLESGLLSINPAQDQMLLYYGYRRVDLFGRQEPEKQLLDFANCAGNFKWWLMVGPGGMGKSRLALEVCLKLQRTHTVGFLPRHSTFAAWDTWKPLHPTLIVVDYVAQRAEAIGAMLQTLTTRATQLPHPVRILLIERTPNGQWYDTLLGSGGDAERRKSTRHAIPGTSDSASLTLPGLDDDHIWSIFQQIFAQNMLDPPDRSGTLAAFRKIDPQGRPLFAIMAADALVRHADIRQWDANDLLQAVLKRERDRWQNLHVDPTLLEQHINLLALATMIGGIPKNGYQPLKDGPLQHLLPTAVKPSLYEPLTGTRHATRWPPLEPDMLGELFVLEHLKPGGDMEHRATDFVHAAWHYQPPGPFIQLVSYLPPMAGFVDRVDNDFREHPAVEIVGEIPSVQTPLLRHAWMRIVVHRAGRSGGAGRTEAMRRLILTATKLAEDHPTEPSLRHAMAIAVTNRGSTRADAGDLPGAMADYTEVIETPGLPAETKIRALRYRSSVYIRQAMLDLAIADCTAVLAMPDAPAKWKADALSNRGSAYASQGRNELAIADCSAVLKMPDTSAEQKACALANRSAAYYHDGKHLLAIADVSTLLDIPDAPVEQKAQGLTNRAMAYVQRGRNDLAIADYSAVLPMPVAAEQKAHALVQRAILYLQHGETDLAVADNTAVLAMLDAPPRWKAAALITRGFAYASQWRNELAIADCSSVLAMPDISAEHKARALGNRSAAYYHDGKHLLAIADVSTLLDIPDAPVQQKAQGLTNRAKAYVQRGRNDLAIADYTAVLALPAVSPEQRVQALFNRGNIRLQQRSFDLAIADYSSVLAIGDQKAQALFNRGYAKCESGDVAGALMDYTALLELPGAPVRDRAMALLNSGKIKRKMGNDPSAFADFKRVTEMSAAPVDLKAMALFNVAAPATFDFPFFSLNALRVSLKRRMTVRPAMLARALHEMIRNGQIFEAGRGWYSTLRTAFTLDRQPVLELVQTLEKRFSPLDFACWSTAQVARYGHLPLARFVSFVYVDRDAMESVASALRDVGYTAFLNPTQQEAAKSFQIDERTVVVRPTITRSPVDGNFAAIEKILVDLYVESRALHLMELEEYRQLTSNLLRHERIAIGTLIKYAVDRRKLDLKDLFGREIN
jgi:tetratricopeptide (TPR) repeat protein